MKKVWTISIAFCFFLMIFLLLEAFGNVKQWEKIEVVDEITLFSSLEKSDTLLPFKAVAELNIPYQKIVMALVDAERKNSWAPKLKYITIHNKISANQFEYSEYYMTPWPFEDREFLLLGTVEYKNDRIRFTAKNSPNKNLADTTHLLANIKVMEFTIIPLSPDKTRVEFIFSGDLGGWIPTFVKNIIQKKWPIRFIQAMQLYIKKNPNIQTRRYIELQKRDISFP